jgi:hypothetical protein
MKLERWALIAEIIGGLAIVVSLLFVGFQLQQTNQLNRANTYLEIMASLNQADAETHAIESTFEAWTDFRENFRAGNIDAEYSSEQVRRIQFALGQRFRIYDAAFYAREYSMIGDVEWSRMERQICGLADSIGGFWESWVRRGMSDGFANFVDNECVRADSE